MERNTDRDKHQQRKTLAKKKQPTKHQQRETPPEKNIASENNQLRKGTANVAGGMAKEPYHDAVAVAWSYLSRLPR